MRACDKGGESQADIAVSSCIEYANAKPVQQPGLPHVSYAANAWLISDPVELFAAQGLTLQQEKMKNAGCAGE
jgi:hypothetical protein